MDDLKVLRIRSLFFYLFLSWRTILTSILLCCLIGGLFTFFKAPSFGVKKGEQAVQFPEGIILPPPPISIRIEEPEDPRDRYSSLEIREMIKDFSKNNAEARQLQDTIGKKEVENITLQESITADPYLQIDPKRQVNKRLKIIVELAEKKNEDSVAIAFLQQNLCSAYLNTLRNGRFYQVLASNFSVQYDSEAIQRLIRIKLDTPNEILLKVTAPDEEQRELLYANCMQEIRRIYEEGEASYIKHTMEIEELPDETVESSSISIEREAIKQKIQENKEIIAKGEQEIEERFYTQFANNVILNRSKEAREKNEAVEVLTKELMVAGASEEDCKQLAGFIQQTKWDVTAINQIKTNLLKALNYDKKQEDIARKTQNETSISDEEKVITAFESSLQNIIETNKSVTDNGQEVERVPLAKPYKRNLVIAFFWGGLLGLALSLYKYWKYIMASDIQNICAERKVQYWGSITYPRVSRKKWGHLLDRLIIKLFGKNFDERKQLDEIMYAKSRLNAKDMQRSDSKAYRLLLPGVKDDEDKAKLLEKLFAADLAGSDYLEWFSSASFDKNQEGFNALQTADGVLFIERADDSKRHINREIKIAQDNNKEIWGVIELQEKFQMQ